MPKHVVAETLSIDSLEKTIALSEEICFPTRLHPAMKNLVSYNPETGTYLTQCTPGVSARPNNVTNRTIRFPV
jgi:hypothetical protein